MTHSHVPVAHLLRQLELYPVKQSSANDLRPAWLVGFIDDVAQLFAPVTETARVGYVSRPDGEGGWCVTLFLGATQTVGGPRDGELRYCDFAIDLLGVQERFQRVYSCVWNAMPQAYEERQSSTAADVVIVGDVHDQRLELRLLLSPPPEARPGMRRNHVDGSLEPA
ncbi:MAG: hypothetical protein D6725_05385 [Planctomycetota bacterium]|nr:MAG: hypothetical protein D6725_05385 [Planctomycetota bacterium]